MPACVIAMYKDAHNMNSIYGERTNHACKIKSLLNLLILMEFVEFNPIGIHLVLVHSFAYQKCSTEIDGDTYHAGILFYRSVRTRSFGCFGIRLIYDIMPTLITNFNIVLFSIYKCL